MIRLFLMRSSDWRPLKQSKEAIDLKCVNARVSLFSFVLRHSVCAWLNAFSSATELAVRR